MVGLGNLLLLATFNGLKVYAGYNSGATATIQDGTIIGTKVNLPTATAAVNQFLGVPFAKSPPERFSPPQVPEPWSKPLLAQAWKPACIQQFNCKLLWPFSLLKR
jgi:carboxylesterase 2